MSYPATLRSGVSEAAFLSLPESLDRVELIDGEVIVSPSPSDRHQRIVVELLYRLRRWCEDHPPAEVRVAPLDVRIGAGRIVQPDLFVVLGGIAADLEGPLDLVPQLVVEVLSSRRSYDRITKRVLYAEAGVAEYWIVDPDERRIERICGDHAAVVTDELRGTLLPGFSLRVDDLFR